MLQLAAAAQPTDLVVTLGVSYHEESWRRDVQRVAQAGAAFLASNPEHRIALVLEDESIALPLTDEATRLASVAKSLARKRYVEGGALFRAYRAASRLTWRDGAKHVIVSASDGFAGAFHVEAFDWLKPSQVEVQLIEQTLSDRSQPWDPKREYLQAERCMVVEADAGVAWPGRRAPVARCDVAHSPLAPPRAAKDAWD
jgi:hypothetical protein